VATPVRIVEQTYKVKESSMRKSREKRPLARKAVLAGAALLLAMAGPAVAGVHDNIVLKNHAGQLITDLDGVDASNNPVENAFSFKQTCFGATGCHGDATRSDNAKYSYDDIEKHSYHAQVAANEYKGFNYWNPDERGPQAALISGDGPKGKNWVQGQGHMGAW
jgi:hypothetical protein